MRKSFMKYIRRFLLITLIAFLSVSCLFNPIVMDKDSGQISIGCGQIRGTDTAFSFLDGLSFDITITSEESDYIYEGNFNNGDTILIDNIQNGVYNVRVFATEGFYEYRANQEITLDFSKIKQDEIFGIFIDVEKIAVNGQFTLDFTSIALNDNDLFNVTVSDTEGKEVFSMKDVSPTVFDKNRYTIPYFFKEGNYNIKVEGGNIGEETYIVNNNNQVTSKKGEAVLYSVNAKAYKKYFVNQSHSTSGNGLIDSPFNDINTALSLCKNEESIIVIDGNYDLQSPIALDVSSKINFCGVNGGKLTNNSGSCIENNGGILILTNIELSSTSNDDIVLLNGSFRINGKVSFSKLNIKDDFLKNGPIYIDGNFTCPMGETLIITLETYNIGKKIISASIASKLDLSSIKLAQSNYFINSLGECDQHSQSVKLVAPSGYTDMNYEVKKNNVVINCGTFTTSTTEIYMDAYKGDNLTINLIGKKDSDNKYYLWDFPHSVIEGVNEINLSTKSNSIYSGYLIINQSGLQVSDYDFPLEVTITDSNGVVKTEIISSKESSPLPYTINLLPGTYTVAIKGNSLEKSFTTTNNVKITSKVETPLTLDYTVSYFIYVDANASPNGIGSYSSPIKTIEEALKLCTAKAHNNIILKSDINLPSSISVNGTFEATIMSDPNHTPSPVKNTINCSNGFIKLITSNTKINLQNVFIKDTSVSGSIPLINIESGTCKIGKDSNVQMIDGNKTGIKIGELGNLEIEDNPSVTGRILTQLSPRIILKNNIDDSCKFFIETPKDLVESDSTCIINATYPYLLKKHFKKFIPIQSGFVINETGYIVPGNSFDNIHTETNLTYDIYSNDALAEVINTIISQSQGKSFKLTLNFAPNIHFISSSIMNPNLTGISTITSITINGTGIESIGDSTFKNFRNLDSITLPDNVMEISRNAFRGCLALTSLELPPNISTIGDNAFYQTPAKITIKGLSSPVNWTVINPRGNETFQITTDGQTNKSNFAKYRKFTLTKSR